MIDDDGESKDDYAGLKGRADALERQLQDVEARATARIRSAELKSEAVRAGIVDLDGLRLIDPKVVTVTSDVEFDANVVIGQLRRDKPWLFGGGDTSSPSHPPAATAPRARFATEMSVDEWRAARAALLRRK